MKVRKFLLSALLFLPLLLQGCDYALFNPKGPVGHEIRGTLFLTVGAMLIVVIPTLLMVIIFAWKYSAKNKKSQQTHTPEWDHSKKIEIFAWGIPIIIILFLATVTYIETHRLDPRKHLLVDGQQVQPKVIDVVALNWKWLFIYPDEKIAAINEVAFPVNQPVEFHITSDSTMNSFFIPRLGSQIYAMSGMESRLNLMADTVGTYPGISAMYSGYGFAGMQFKAHALSLEDYSQWVNKVRSQGTPLTDDVFKSLQPDSRWVPVTYYSEADPGLYSKVINSFSGVQRND
ncbi:ubiquinol oxidase subunit II [Brackiella oedipodis]|uniref:ubiquinol oxidase subunit II n=1 Tax=Brackiella oedipodis TaxID=124225 RepID=UPI00056E8AA4|nr:ubiquinol oxidase subunit II [Brackiella oedipodis]